MGCVRLVVAAVVVLFATGARAQPCPVDRCFRGRPGPLQVECILQWTAIVGELTVCEDGATCDLDGTVDGACRFAVAPCLDVNNCTVEPSPPVTGVDVRPASEPVAGIIRDTVLALAADMPGIPRCALPVTVDVPSAGRGLSLRVTVTAGGRRDRDRVKLRCLPAGTRPSFARDVQPILSARCTPGCHEPGGRVPYADFSEGTAIDTIVGRLVEAGRRGSRLALTLRRMPPGCHRTLPPEYAPGGCPTRDELDTIRDWIALGAPDN